MSRSLEHVEQIHPEWKPWLRVVRTTLTEFARPGWSAAVPPPQTPGSASRPLLANARLSVQGSLLADFLRRLMTTLLQSDRHSSDTEARWYVQEADAAAAFHAAICADEERLRAIGERLQALPSTFCVVATQLPLPFLHACSRAWNRAVAQSWSESYCPICGSWPALVNVCGVERRRYARCGRCAAAWIAPSLLCLYCGNSDHTALGSLINDELDAAAAIEICHRCQRYTKVMTLLKLEPSSPVLIDDLLTVELDILASERGYSRPTGTGYPLNIMLNGRDRLQPS